MNINHNFSQSKCAQRPIVFVNHMNLILEIWNGVCDPWDRPIGNGVSGPEYRHVGMKILDNVEATW